MAKDIVDVSGKIALVSGASRGIGEAIARGLAEHGAEVIVTSRDLEACEAVAASIREGGGKAVALKCHAGKMEDIDTLFAEITSRYGRLDILINCGGTSPYYGPIAETPLAAYEKTMDVNLRGPFFMSAKAVPLMRKAGGGAIVSVASVYAIRAGVNAGVYSITKAALVSMTEAFAKEYGPENIRVNAILPGLVDTRMTDYFKSDVKGLQAKIDTFPLRRMADPEDMVGGVLYLVSEAARYTTGVSLVMDGGATL